MLNINNSNNSNKHKYAEVFTPIHLVKEIIDLISLNLDLNSKRIYEPGVGKGAFLNEIKKHNIFSYEGCDINLTEKWSEPNIHISEGDFFNQPLKTYDLIIGNPPFYNNGFKGPPCSKTRKGTTIWPQIVKKCFEHLETNGILAMILPCIWLKPDKEKIYDLFTKHQILYLRVYSCVEGNKIFGYKAQTPCCYVIVQKCPAYKPMQIYDNEFVPFVLKPGYCIPTSNIKLIQSFFPTLKINPIKIAYIKKINPLIIKNPINNFPIITTYKEAPYGFESMEPGKYQGVPKLIMAHKTKPLLMLDISGTYGLYGRDKYIFLCTNTNANANDNTNNLYEQYEYLSQPIVQTIIKSFTIRMNFVEKDIFNYVSIM
jgi:hypothetical protein